MHTSTSSASKCQRKGNVLVYKENGVASYFITLKTYFAIWWFGLFNPAIFYDHMGEIFSTLFFTMKKDNFILSKVVSKTTADYIWTESQL